MDVNGTFSQRLRRLRKMRGLSAQALCTKMGDIVTRQAVSKYENGKCLPDSTVLLALSHALGVKPDYFFREQEGTLASVHYRKLSTLRAKDRDAIVGCVQDTVERMLQAEEINAEQVTFAPVLTDLTVSDEHDASTAATRLREQWHMGTDAVSHVVAMLEDHGIVVVEVDAPPAFSGMNGTIEGNRPVIVVNSNMTAERKRFTALHELGHALLHFDDNLPEKSTEKLCNAFASEVLLPQDAFIKAIGMKRRDIAVVELRNMQAKYGLSIDALMYKAFSLNVISPQRYRTFCIRKNTEQAFKEEVEKSAYDHESGSHRLENLVYRALANDGVTTSKAAELLNVSIDDVVSDFILAG